MKIIKNLFLVLLILSIMVGGFVGYAIGDALIDAAEYTRPKDVIEYRIGFPVFGAVVGLFSFFIFLPKDK